MKNKFTLLTVVILFSLRIYAQAPNLINYQAVARDASGVPLVSTPVSVLFEIRQSTPNGTVVYSETHSASTNQFGLFNIAIGGGTPVSGTFAGINWSTGLYYLYIEVNGDPMPATQLLSVPYALHANTATSGTPGADGNDNLSVVTPEAPGANCATGGNMVEVGVDDNANGSLEPGEVDYTYFVCNGLNGSAGSSNDTSATNEIQMLSISNDTIFLSNGGFVVLPSTSGDNWGTDVVNTTGGNITGDGTAGNPLAVIDNDTSATNELELPMVGNNIGDVLKWNGTNWIQGSDNVIDADNDPTNEIELPPTAVLNQVLTWNGSAWVAQNASSGADNWGSQVVITTGGNMSGDGTAGNPLAVSDNDTSATNEIQNLSVSGNTINISGGTGTNISATPPNTGDYLYWNGLNWVAQTVTGDNWGTDVVNTSGINISGDGTPGNPLVITEGDPSPTNEIQNLSISGNTINITGGTGASISTNFPTTGDMLFWNGSDWTAQPVSSINVNDADADPSNELITNFNVNGTNDSLIIDEGGTHHAVPFSAFNDGDWTINGTNLETATTGNVGIGPMHSTIGGPGYFLTSGKALTIATTNSYLTTPPAALELVSSSASGTDIMGRVAFGYVVNPPTLPTYVGGIEMDKNGSMMFSTNGANERVRIDYNGDMGVGTTTPSHKLHVFQPAGAGEIVLETPLAGNLQYQLVNTNTDYAFELSGTNLNIKQAGTNLMTFSSGNVGVGTNPLYSVFDVNGQITMRTGAAAGFIPVSDPNGTMTWTDPTTIVTADDGDWTISGSDMFSAVSGNVGIGTSTPIQKLHVNNGTFRVSDASGNFDIFQNGTQTQFTLSNPIAIAPNGGGIKFTMDDGNADFFVQLSIQDGTQGLNRVLTSDASGYASWVDLSTILPTGLWSGSAGDIYPTTITDNVGIGTTTPAEKLDVTGNIQSSLGYKLSGLTSSVLYNSGSVLVLNNSLGQEIRLTQGGNARLTVAAAGNVGVGTIAPSGMFDVTTSTLNRGSQVQNSFTSASDKYGIYANASGGGAGDNIGVWGESFGAATGINYGVGGQALGSGPENRAIYGSASGGTANWAGYFDLGDVNINNSTYIGGNLLVGTVPSIQAKAQINGTGYSWAFKILGGGSNTQVLGVETGTGNTIIGNTTSSPGAQLEIVNSTASVNATTDGILNVGQNNTAHLTMDGNEIQARTSTGTSTLYLNYWGSDVDIARSSGSEVGIGVLPSSSYKLYVSTSTNSRAGTFINSFSSTGFIYGVRGEGNNPNASGEGIGVYGRGQGGASGTAYGLYGYATGAGTNWALYASGNSFTTSGAWTPSDENLKTNIKQFEGAIDKLSQLSVKTYQFDIAKYPTMNFSKRKQYGIMAQNLEQVFPEMVLESEHHIPNEEGDLTDETLTIKAVNYEQLIPVLIKAVQEQQQMIDELRQEIQDLKNQ